MSEDEGVGSNGEDIALGMALEKSRRKRTRRTADPSPQDLFLAAQGRKLELEMRHLRLSHFDRLLTVTLKLVTAALALVVAAGLAFMVISAMRADSVVVDVFEAPAPLAAEGLNGTVLASQLLDRLRMLQAHTQTASAHRGIKDAWSGNIKVEVPQTGVSIGELERYLHAWLGHEIHVGGNLETAADRLTLTVRGDGFESKTFEGGRQDLPKLVDAAAEYIYGEAEPYLASAYLETHGRDVEAIQLVQAKYASAKPADRPFLLNAWGNGLGDLGRSAESLPIYLEALRLKPDYWVAYSNIISVKWYLGDEEGAWRSAADMAKASGRGGLRPRASEFYFLPADVLTQDLEAVRAGLIQDMEKHGGVGSNVIESGPLIADALARMHDPQAAELYLETAPDEASGPWLTGMKHFVHGWEALDRGDWGRAASELEGFETAYANPVVRTQVPGYDCWLAPAEEMAGRPERADAVLRSGGRFVDCYRFRADILDHRGDWIGAQKAYAQAVALAPDLPAAYYSWGVALARHGDLRGAVVKYAAAAARGPHWADPYKAWGDTLAAQGHWAEAVGKYETAALHAPKWRELQLALAGARRHTNR